MKTLLLMVCLCAVVWVTGCAVNPEVSGPQALQRDPDQPAETGATTADRP